LNGRAHATASYALAPVTGVAVGLLLADLQTGVLAAAGCVAGVLLSPDLDQESITESESLVYRKGGNVLGHLWRAYWMLYALVLPHRSVLSHGPLIGTAGRLAYLLAPWIIWALAGGWIGDLVFTLYPFWPVALGLAVSDLAHWAMDQV